MNAVLDVGMIWAEARGGVIGSGGTMPWHVPEDMEHFRNRTRGCPVVMGRKTWESLPQRFRPLPGRTNIVITGDAATSRELEDAGAVPASSLPEAVSIATARAGSAQEVWIMGGGAIYAEAVESGIANLASVTRLDFASDGDTFAPELDPAVWEMVDSAPDEGWNTSSTDVEYRIETYRRR